MNQFPNFTLPQLTGSPKQIAWAEKIRATFVNDFYIGKFSHKAGLSQYGEECAAGLDAKVQEFLAISTDSKEWIDGRDGGNFTRFLLAKEFQAWLQNLEGYRAYMAELAEARKAHVQSFGDKANAKFEDEGQFWVANLQNAKQGGQYCGTDEYLVTFDVVTGEIEAIEATGTMEPTHQTEKLDDRRIKFSCQGGSFQLYVEHGTAAAAAISLTAKVMA